MIPVTQTIVDPIKGNCFAACIASIFEVAIDEVPGLDREDWTDWDVLCAWLRDRNVWMYSIDKVSEGVLPGYAIGRVESTFEGKTHAVVVKDGKIVHCPNPNRHGMNRPLIGFHIFVAINPAA